MNTHTHISQNRVFFCHKNNQIAETEAGESLRVQGQPGLHSEFQDSQNYTVRVCLENLIIIIIIIIIVIIIMIITIVNHAICRKWVEVEIIVLRKGK